MKVFSISACILCDEMSLAIVIIRMQFTQEKNLRQFQKVD